MGNQPSTSNSNPNNRIVHAVGGKHPTRKSVRLEDNVEILNNNKSDKQKEIFKHMQNENHHHHQYHNHHGQNNIKMEKVPHTSRGFTVSKSTENLATKDFNRRENTSFKRKPVEMSKSLDTAATHRYNNMYAKEKPVDSIYTTEDKRKLWWNGTSALSSSHTTAKAQKVKIDAQARIDHRSDWTPSKQRKKRIETYELNWRARPALNTKENLHYTPGGGNKRYPTERLEWNVKPKVDSGFVQL